VPGQRLAGKRLQALVPPMRLPRPPASTMPVMSEVAIMFFKKYSCLLPCSRQVRLIWRQV
jgi:hypothetical protein